MQENEVQRTIREAKELVRRNGRCRVPRANKDRQICTSGALGLPDDCSSVLEGMGGCEALRLQAAGTLKGSCEAVRLIAAEIRTRWTAEYTTNEEGDDSDVAIWWEGDFYRFDYDVSDVEICGDFSFLTDDDTEIYAVMDEACARAGGDRSRQN